MAVLAAGAAAQSLPPVAQELFDRARASSPARYRFAVDQGAKFVATSDGRSFAIVWYPQDAPANAPLIVTLHGSSSWAFDELFLWRDQAVGFGYGILALQWWFGDGEFADSYYQPAELHRELRALLRQQGVGEAAALLHGFSRGAANTYAVAALDASSGDRFYAMILANSGGASADFPPNAAISQGRQGYNVFSGTYWSLFCGGADPNPDRDGCPAMRRTADWIDLYGGVVELFIEDQAAGHGGFHMSPAHIREALDAFRRNLESRAGAPASKATWNVIRDADFEVPNAGTPNVGWVNGAVWLSVSGMRLFRSPDGSNHTNPEMLNGLGLALAGSGYGPGEVVPREDSGGNPVFYVLALAPRGENRAVIFRMTRNAAGALALNPPAPVYEGGPGDGKFLGVPDITSAGDGRLRLTYVSLGAAQRNSRSALSADDGFTFTPERKNLFGDLAVPNPRAQDMNVDPAILKLAGGGYLAVTMRAARLYMSTSIDGRTFVPAPQPAIEPENLYPGANGLFDPTLVQLPDGRIFMYATAGSGPSSTMSRVIRAEIQPR